MKTRCTFFSPRSAPNFRMSFHAEAWNEEVTGVCCLYRAVGVSAAFGSRGGGDESTLLHREGEPPELHDSFRPPVSGDDADDPDESRQAGDCRSEEPAGFRDAFAGRNGGNGAAGNGSAGGIRDVRAPRSEGAGVVECDESGSGSRGPRDQGTADSGRKSPDGSGQVGVGRPAESCGHGAGRSTENPGRHRPLRKYPGRI